MSTDHCMHKGISDDISAFADLQYLYM